MAYIVVPALGEGIENVTVACWLIQEGERIQKETDIVEVVTDKATFSIPAEHPCILKEILIAEGQDARVGEALAVVEPI